MQFKMNHKVGTAYSTVKFQGFTKLNNKAYETLMNTFEKLGLQVEVLITQDRIYKFPSFITSEVIKEVIHNTCFVCGGLMKDSTAFQNTLVSSDDFGNDSGQRGTTQSRVGKPQYLKVRKCSSCGHSHT